MATYAESKERGSSRYSRDSSSRRNSRGGSRDGPRRSYNSSSRDGPRRSYGSSSRDRPRRSYGDRDSNRGGGRRDFQMTTVTCDSCGEKCEVPFKPTSNKPVYCDACFRKKEHGDSSKPSNSISSNDLDIINEKLNKIMKALEIE